MPGEGAKEAWHSVFVYGTLKSGESNNHFLKSAADGRATLIGAARTVKKWPLVLVSSYEIPCLLPYEGVGYVRSTDLDSSTVMPTEEATEDGHYVFVYGTLKSGERYNHFLARPTDGRASLVGPARTVKKWPLVLAFAQEIPCMLPFEGVGHEVCGEVYEVDDRMLELLDRLESHPDFYVRSLEDVYVLSQPQSDNSEAEATLDSAKSSPKPSGNNPSFPWRRKVWVYFMRKNEEDLLTLPHVSNYTLKAGIKWPELTADKEESQSFLVSEFRNVPKDDSCSSG